MGFKTTGTVGILGGMGPEATSLFFQRIVQYTPANSDQEHLKIIIYNDPKIPDRTEAIVNNGVSPIEKAREGLLFLERSNVDLIAIPCVTIHYFFDELVKFINTPILNIVQETASYIKETYPDIKRVGILATTGTIKGYIFQKIFHPQDLEIIMPGDNGQKILMESIYGRNGIKAGITVGHPKQQIITVAQDLVRNGAEIIVGGCTEIPILLGQVDLQVPFMDTLVILAQAVIRKVGLVPRQ